jgi:hypothetical protein
MIQVEVLCDGRGIRALADLASEYDGEILLIDGIQPAELEEFHCAEVVIVSFPDEVAKILFTVEWNNPQVESL